MRDCYVVHIDTRFGTNLSERGIVHAARVVWGQAVVVMLEHRSGAVGIGNVVQRKNESVEAAERRCIEHALKRATSFSDMRAAGG